MDATHNATTAAPARPVPGLTPRHYRLIAKLADGGKYAVMHLANALKIGDPRSAIRDLRRAGYIVRDEWRRNASDTGSYKLFWIDRGDLAAASNAREGAGI